jgi:hypothetical protein
MPFRYPFGVRRYRGRADEQVCALAVEIKVEDAVLGDDTNVQRTADSADPG